MSNTQPDRPDQGQDLGSQRDHTDPEPLESELQTADYKLPSESDEGAFAPGQVIGDRYRIDALLGRGGMGEVWRAYDLKLRVEVGLKSVLRDRFGSDRALDLLRSEVRTAREVMSPNVCRIFDLIEIGEHELVSMEYIDGTTLLGLLQSRGPLDLGEAGKLATQFLAGLQAIHDAGLVHRDIKPENLMITRTGRVVVMDFGIARQATSVASGTVAGTPAYMAPEQQRGGAVDARTDLFAAGVVLAEMVSEAGVRDMQSRQSLWQGVHNEPAVIPESPWRPVLKRAVAKDPADRFASADGLARALEEVTLRVDGAEDKRPYPGLASFGIDDAEYFFGREAEVETLWKRLEHGHLMAVVGPSGAGKSSFLNAGLLASLPAGWGYVRCNPDNSPMAGLAKILVPELSGDTEAMQELLRFEDPEAALSVLSRWRKRHEHALIIVDQFEELFTLNPPETQSSFATVLSRIALEADIHVVLSMRDDFFFQCHRLPALAPVFSEVTPLGPPTGHALRQALIRPALSCGYRFEDDALVDEMISEVSEERGALPLLAFAAARLWDLRDPAAGLLTRSACERIGGVSGALAQHAEATLTSIGDDQGVVRELFRNLVTAQGTRASREIEELLSVFGDEPGSTDREAARTALRALVDARLLTTFEAPMEGSDEARQRVEIIHESLLTAWPRLVGWRTKDAGSAQLRDELRQAAELWDKRGRPDDLLWTGNSFRELQVWRVNYQGGLTNLEETFVHAMEALERRGKRQRRIVISVAFLVLIVMLGVIANFWRKAVSEARRAEASHLLAMAQLELDEGASSSLAYARASLELEDSPTARRFALEALWQGPTVHVLASHIGIAPAFSPDGRQLAIAIGDPETFTFQLKLFDSAGGPGRVLESSKSPYILTAFDSESRLLVVQTLGRDDVRIWSVPEAELLQTLELAPGSTAALPSMGRGLVTFAPEEDGRVLVTSWSLQNLEPEILGRISSDSFSPSWTGFGGNIDATGQWLAFHDQGGMYLAPLDGMDSSPPRWLGEAGNPAFAFGNDNLAVLEFMRGEEGALSELVEVMVLRPFSDPQGPSRRFPPAALSTRPNLQPNGRLLAAGTFGGALVLYDLEAPPGASPITLRRRDQQHMTETSFHPNGQWLATGDNGGAALWALGQSYPQVLQGHTSPIRALRFDAEGEFLVTAGHSDALRRWPLSGNEEVRQIVGFGMRSFDIDPSGKVIAAARENYGSPFFSLEDGSEARAKIEGDFWSVAFSPNGGLFAGCGGQENAELAHARVVNLQSGEERILSADDGRWVFDLAFIDDDRLVTSGLSGVRIWDIENESFELITETSSSYIAVSRGHEELLVIGMNAGIGKGDSVTVYDLSAGTNRKLTSHGSQVVHVAIDVSGQLVATGSDNGTVRIGPISGEEPHLLFGHTDRVHAVAFDPKGRWLASGSADSTVRLWPIPEGQPFHTLPHEDLLSRLEALTNYRVVADPESDSGYRLEIGPFAGWETVPSW